MTEEIAAAEDGADEIEDVIADETEAEEVEETEAVEEATEDESEEEESEPEEIELDYGGNKFRLPKGALPEEDAAKLDEFLKGSWRSHTEKSMEVAEQRKALEAQQGAIQKLSGLQGEMLQQFSRGQAIQDELQQIKQQVDLPSLWQSSPDEARQVSDYISAKEAELQSIASDVSQREQAFTQEQAAFAAKQAEDGKQRVLSRVPDFAANESSVVEYAIKEYGVSEAEAKNWGANPVAAEAMYKAWKFDQMQAASAKAAKPKPADAKPVKPVKGKGNARPRLDIVKDADKMSTEAWLRERNQQLKQRA